MAFKATKTDASRPGVVIVSAEGDLDATGAKDFDAMMSPLAEDGAVKAVLVDCRNLNYLVSAALRIVLQSVTKMRPRKASIHFVAPNQVVANVLKSTGFLSFVTIADDVESCLRALE